MTTKEKPAPGGNRAAGNGHALTKSNSNILERHFCYCRPGIPCVFCLTFNRIIRCIESRAVLS